MAPASTRLGRLSPATDRPADKLTLGPGSPVAVASRSAAAPASDAGAPGALTPAGSPDTTVEGAGDGVRGAGVPAGPFDPVARLPVVRERVPAGPAAVEPVPPPSEVTGASPPVSPDEAPEPGEPFEPDVFEAGWVPGSAVVEPAPADPVAEPPQRPAAQARLSRPAP